MYCEYIDMGTTDNDSLPVAKESVVFIVVAVNDNFKLPVGYFLMNGLGALERRNLVKQCLSKLIDVGVDVIGAVHKVRHAIFDQFGPPPPCHTLSHIADPPIKYVTSRNTLPRITRLQYALLNVVRSALTCISI